MSQMARLISERRRRMVATILGHAEREFYAQLTDAQRTEFRAKTLGAIDEFCDLTRDILKVMADDVMINQHALELLEALHDNQKAIVRKLGD